MPARRAFLGGALALAAASLVRPACAATVKTRDGTELFVKDTGGSGRPVIMTHAWPLSADIWDYQATALAKAGHRVVTYDRRGFGRSSEPAAGYDFDTFADDLAAVIQQTGLSDATLVGYSMGGGEVVRYFSRHGGRGIAKAGLVGAAAYYLLKTPDNPNGLDAAVFDGIKQGVRGDRGAYLAGLLRDVFCDAARPATTPATPEVLAGALSMAMQASVGATVGCVDAFSRTDFRPELAAVRVPTLVLHGTADIPVPLALGKATAAGIARATVIEYPEASHGIVVTERDRVTRDLLAFIAG